jgi:hypothetical protein
LLTQLWTHDLRNFLGGHWFCIVGSHSDITDMAHHHPRTTF